MSPSQARFKQHLGVNLESQRVAVVNQPGGLRQPSHILECGEPVEGIVGASLWGVEINCNSPPSQQARPLSQISFPLGPVYSFGSPATTPPASVIGT